MIIQLHWQDRKNTEKTECKAQWEWNREKNSKIDSTEDLRNFISEIQKKYPIPEDKQWLACEESSKFFDKEFK